MDLVKLYVGRGSMDAGHVCAYLEEQGVRAVVLGEQFSFARGELPLTPETLPAVWVSTDDVDRALELVRAYLQEGRHHGDDASASPPWTCPVCGERIEGIFGVCWQCGAAQPAIDERTTRP